MRALTGFCVLGIVAACSGDAVSPPRPEPLDPTDRDRDGAAAQGLGGTDCDDADPSISASAPERCDGRDNDCDGVIDDGFGCVAGAQRPCGLGVGFVEHCSGDCTWGPCVSPDSPNDCPAGESSCAPGTREACATSCGSGERTCGPDCSWGECVPPSEVCNGVDDDCDGELDEDAWGLTSGLETLPWTGTTLAAQVVATTAGHYAVAQWAVDQLDVGVGSQVVVSWFDATRTPIGEPILVEGGLWSMVEFTATAAGERVAVAYDRSPEFAVQLAIVSEEGVAATWQIPLRIKTELFWTGSELGAIVFPDMALLRFDEDGQQLADPVDVPGHFMSRVAWSGEDVVLPAVGEVLWVGLDGTVHLELALDDPAARPAVARVDTGIAIAYPRDGTDVVLRVVDAAGNDLWQASALLPGRLFADDVLLAPPVEVADGFLTVTNPRASMWSSDFLGWVVDADGHTVSRPDYWLAGPQTNPPAWWSVASDGDVAVLVHSSAGLSVASLGCRTAP